ncbi:hypothetical protein [Agromyces ramosus]|uniref:Uncharacterized protein n=1 Tax=Agromyces ramosus TaxID=33879 RepID=A0ABU0R5A7_9MICO|nr:hypothetical protein [Agromyces ramosus]MDQ0893270.1 hypothetical protein [Agromyces ramosus]
MSSTTPGADPERHDDTTADDAAVPAPTPEPAPDEPQVGDAYDDAAPDDARAADVTTPEPAPPADDEAPDAATARLDAAVERANADAAASEANGIDEATDTPAPVPAEAVRRDTYVPAATVAAGTTAGAATLADEPEPYIAPQPAQQTIYVQAPTPPKMRSNRGFGALVALLGTVLFALLYAGVAYLLLLAQGNAGEANAVFTEFLVKPVFWVPVAAFFIGFALLAVIVNRGPWWSYAVFSLLVAVLVYFSYIGGALLTVEAWTRTAEQAGEFIGQRWLDPFAIAAFVIAHEIPIWLGGWIAARGRSVTERNRLAREEYDRELAAGPQVQR